MFLYEIIWNLSLAALLVWLGHHRRIRPPGLFALYVAGYSAFRIFAELIRVDPAHHVLGLRLNRSWASRSWPPPCGSSRSSGVDASPRPAAGP